MTSPPGFKANPFGGSTNANAPTPIGVEPGYSATLPTGLGAGTDYSNVPPDLAGALNQVGPTFQRQPQYFKGMEWQPATLPPQQISALQAKLKAAGLYTADYIDSSWGPADADAYSRLLATANAAGTDETTALTQAMAHPTVKTTPRAPLTVVLSNTKDIQDVAKQVGDSLYGGALPADTVQAIVDAVHNQETATQTNAYNLADTGGTIEGGATTPGVAVSSSDIKNVINDTVRAQHPNEVAATQFSNMFDNIIGTLTNNTSGYAGVKYP